MLSGFNTNIDHHGVLFHVQTEDSGRKHPHVITHLYHRGTILASEKCGYAERLESSDLEREVKALMESQHRAMVERLEGGELDDVICERLGLDAFGDIRKPEPATPLSASAEETLATGVAAVSAERPLDELVLEYLVESARQPLAK
jgi:hypothetical protein